MPLWNPLSNPNSGDDAPSNRYGPPDDKNDDLDFPSLLTRYRPLLQKLTLSSFVGYCSGITAKRIGKSMAFLVGLAFISLQGLAYKGFIEVDWKKVKGSVVEVVDTVRCIMLSDSECFCRCMSL